MKNVGSLVCSEAGRLLFAPILLAFSEAKRAAAISKGRTAYFLLRNLGLLQSEGVLHIYVQYTKQFRAKPFNCVALLFKL